MDRRTACRALASPAWLALAMLAPAAGRSEPPQEFARAGQAAMDWTRRFVELGPRPAGSLPLFAQFNLIRDALSKLSCTIEVDAFVAPTPVGALTMRNVIARFGPPQDRGAIVVSGHYDTFRRVRGFVGANDGGSSAGLLMALAQRLHETQPGPVWLAFFDGEESTVAWRDQDHTYGSRRVARRWASDGTAERVRALINVDMIGDRDLELLGELNSTHWLRERVWSVGRRLGYQREFGQRSGYVEDDHVPFLRAGIPSVNLIDFEYGPGNRFWHTREDSMAKLAPRSFAVMLHVLDEVIRELLQD